MNYDDLKTELAKPAYEALTDQEAADALNAETIVVRQLVPLWQIEKHAIENGYRLAIEAAAAKWVAEPSADQQAANQVYGAAKIALSYLANSRFENLDFDLDSTKAMLAALVAGGIVTQANADALDAMANGTTSRREQLKLPPVGSHHVAYARSLSNG
jgi:hypothetical protein